MSSSLKDRIIKALVLFVTDFIFFSVLSKLFVYREDWLICSIMWSVSWAVGMYAADTLTATTKEKSIIEKICYRGIISTAVTLLMLFITGVVIGLTNWNYIVSNTCVHFGVSLFINGWQEEEEY